MFGRVLGLLRPSWRLYSAAVVIGVVEIVAGLAFPLAQQIFLDDVIDGATGIALPLALMGLLAVAMVAARSFGRHLFTVVSERVGVHTRGRLVRRVLERPADESTGDVLAATTSDIEAMCEVHRVVIGYGIISVLELLGTLAVITVIDVRLLLAAVPVMVAYLITQRVLTPRMRAVGDDVQRARARLLGIVHECFAARRDIKVFGRADWALRRQHAVGHDKAAAVTRQSRLEVAALASAVIYWATVIGISAFGASQIAAGAMTIGGLIAVLTYFGGLEQPVTSLIGLNARLQAGLAAANRVFAYIDNAAVDAESPRGAATRSLRSGAAVDAPFRLAIEGLRYRHVPQLTCLDGVDLVAEPGELVAVVGATGSGKSTLVNLVLGLISPDEGRVLIDGIDRRSLPPPARYDRIGFSASDSTIFEMSVTDNIRFGVPDATDDDVRTAAALGGAAEFIDRLPDGYATAVGERGSRLSTGQRQRLALARALLRRPGLLVLDEATSALDSHTEHMLLDRLLEMPSRPTTLVITHRLSTLDRADRIYVLERGLIAEQGRHDALLRSQGAYFRLARQDAA